MNLALSNFAWDYPESENIFSQLNEIGIKNIELVLTKYNSWESLNNKTILDYKKELINYDMNPYSLQSLFYNINCTFEDTDIVIDHFKRLIDYSEILGLKILVFGSPSLRKKINNLSYNLSKIFNEVDAYLENKNINLVIEPNTISYGGEYFTSVSEITEFIISNNLKNIKTMIDTHNILLENNDPLIDIDKYFDYIYHIHISEPGLNIIKDELFHINFSNKLKEVSYNKMVVYEVNKAINLKESIKLFSEIYK
jgi:sugar phosphate isomerase/epimerase